MRRVVFIAVLCAFVASPVTADFVGTIEVDFDQLPGQGVIPGMSVALHSDNAGYDNSSFTAGVYNIKVRNSTYTPDLYLGDGSPTEYPIEAFCIDILDNIPPDFKLYDIKTLPQVPDMGAAPSGGMGTAKAGYVAQLLDTYWTDWSVASNRTLNSILYSTNEIAAALQVAIWEVADEALPDNPTPVPPAAGWSVTDGAGTFYLNAISDDNVETAANWMLTSLGTLGTASYQDYIGLTHPPGQEKPPEYQDFVVRVPVPGAVLLGVLGLGVVGWKLRKYA